MESYISIRSGTFEAARRCVFDFFPGASSPLCSEFPGAQSNTIALLPPSFLLLAAELLKCTDFEDIMGVFRDLPGSIDTDALVDTAFRLSLSSKTIHELSEEFDAITKANYPACSPAAGHGLAAHEKAAAAAAAAPKGRSKR